MEFYFITSDHLEDQIWFKDEEDFIAAMNVIPLIAAMAGVRVVAFVLMSNHVHFILYCSYEQAVVFIKEFKRHHAYLIRRKYGIEKILRRNKVDIQKMEISEDSLERTIAYVQMNPVAANICSHPSAYPWGTGNSFFNVSPPKGIPVESLSDRTRYRLLHSKLPAPGGLMLGDGGFILPESYVEKKMVESVFKTPKRMNFCLNNSSKAKQRLSSTASEVPVFRDHIILPVLEDLCRTLYNKKSVRELSTTQQAEVLRQLRFRFSSNINQMARVTGLSYETVTKLLDSF